MSEKNTENPISNGCKSVEEKFHVVSVDNYFNSIEIIDRES